MGGNTDKDTQQMLPAYITLPVLRETYCDQSTTDAVLEGLWQNAPGILAEMAEEEKWIFPECRSSIFVNACYGVEEYIRENALDKLSAGNTDLAVLDLVHEVSRRLRRSLGLKEIPAFGNALADGPQGTLPALAPKEISHDHDWRSDVPMTQEMADMVCQAVYEKDPALMFAFAEQRRKMIYSYIIEENFNQLIAQTKKEHGLDKTFGFRAELQARIDRMCEMPSYDELQEALGE